MKVGEAASWGGPVRMVLPARTSRINLGAIRYVRSRRKNGWQTERRQGGHGRGSAGRKRKGALEGRSLKGNDDGKGDEEIG